MRLVLSLMPVLLPTAETGCDPVCNLAACGGGFNGPGCGDCDGAVRETITLPSDLWIRGSVVNTGMS